MTTSNPAPAETDNPAAKTILKYIEGLHTLGPLVCYDSFDGCGYQGAHAALERTIQVVVAAIPALPPTVARSLNRQHVKRLQELSRRLDDATKPIPTKELWRAYTVLLGGIEEALTGTDTRKDMQQDWEARRLAAKKACTLRELLLTAPEGFAEAVESAADRPKA